ncbi:MAG: hypothetical protein PHO10_00940 [Gemmiger sp.]|nr:hypothetical protein [Gemmiger sp.]
MENSMVVETYLQNMQLKKVPFGGYDPEDVILKIQEIVKLSAQGGGAGGDKKQAERITALENQLLAMQEQSEENARTQQELTERAEAAEQELEALKQEQAQSGTAPQGDLKKQLEAAKAVIITEQTKRMEAENRLRRFAQQGLQAKEGFSGYAAETEKLHALLMTLESAKADILNRYAGEAKEEERRVRLNNAQLQHSNEELQRILSQETRKLQQGVDDLLQKTQQVKAQITNLEQGNE